MKLKYKFLIPLVSVLMISFTIFVLLLIEAQLKEQRTDLYNKAERTTNLIVHSIKYTLWNFETNSLAQTCNSFFEDKELVKIVIRDTMGREQIRLEKQDFGGNKIIKKKSVSFSDHITDNRIIGEVETIHTDYYIDKSIKAMVHRFISISLAVCIIIIILVFTIFNIVLRPLNDISKSLEQISQNDFNIHLIIKTKDEIGKLGLSINKTAQKLKENLTKRKLNEKALQKSEDKFRHIFESANVGKSLTLPNGKLQVNKAFSELLGYTQEEMSNMTWQELTPPEEIEAVSKRIAPLLNNEQDSIRFTKRYIHKNGSHIWADVSTAIQRDADCKPLHFITTIVDITERRQAEAEREKLRVQLAQAQKMESIGHLAGGIAHDFNNILYPIIGFTQLSQNELPIDHPVQKSLTDILDGAKRASDLVKRILHFSRQKEPELKPTILQPVIKETLKLLRSTIPSNIDVTTNLYDGQDAVLCDSSEIHEIILNLCTNAYHAIAGNNGVIIVDLNQQNPPSNLDLSPGEYICLSVTDNGIGISDKIKDKIFEPYVTTKDIGKGTGLGLSVVYGIVKGCNGGIKFDSSPETGTTFKIFLPITDQIVDSQEKLSSKGITKTGNEHVLFIDDEDSIVRLGISSLKKYGYEVTGFTDSSEALCKFKEDPKIFDLIITDMAMPNLIGSELSQKILEIRPDIPIIICSGYSDKLEKEKSMGLKVSAFLDKPLSIFDLVKKTREILDKQKG